MIKWSLKKWGSRRYVWIEAHDSVIYKDEREWGES